MIERIAGIIQKYYPLTEITPETRFLEELQVDSLSFIELIVEFEKEFGIKISPNDIENIQTVGELVVYIGKNGLVAE